jgi:hypothetical protein
VAAVADGNADTVEAQILEVQELGLRRAAPMRTVIIGVIIIVNAL